ncbi:MAG: RNA polymerase sigma factor [Planctomycetota bacterium]|jgi:RNA polymerase sigma-70 factor (ECF subfamily)
MAAPLRDEIEIEEPVIAAIRTGDRYAFGEFVSRHEAWVRSVIFSVLGRTDGIDDAAQIVWTSVWQRIGELRDPQSWRAWLYRLARNAAVDAGREQTRRRNRGRTAAFDAVEPATYGGVDRATGREDEECREVLSAIMALPAIYREPFVLRHMNDWSYRRISDVMGLPVDTVETRLVRARRLLRDVLVGRIGQGDVAGD